MKRSQAVKDLAKMIIVGKNAYKEENGEKIHLDELQQANLYLGYCEEIIGMSPPFVDDYVNDKSLDLIGRNWEPEDET